MAQATSPANPRTPPTSSADKNVLWLKRVVLLVSWPLMATLLWVTGNKPAPGARWADVNEGRGQFLAITGSLWMFGVLLWLIWKLVFSVVLPYFERRRDQSSAA
jgi:hypothetical protein